MPTISLVRDHLFEAIGKTYSDEQFDELCFEFGVEVDGVETEIVEFTADGSKGEFVIYKIDIPANRYDLLCMEGFARALRIFIGTESSPAYRRLPAAAGKHVLTVERSTNSIRPYAVCAVLRGLNFNKRSYKSFIDLQEKLHQNICRKRTYVAIGTHDLDTLQGPFRYRALPPEEINFVPLTETAGRSFNGKELLDFYREDPSAKHLKPYTDIIYSSPVYPVIHDSAGTVLSLPPIINSRHSRIQMHTTNVFIECTATDLTKANIVLDTVVAMFSEYCADPFTAEEVEVVYEDETVCAGQITPLLSTRTCDAKVEEINSTIGIDIDQARMCDLCTRMQLGPTSYVAETNSVRVTVPPTRSDVLHPVDVIEDIAIAYGYNNIKQEIPATLTIGAPLPINHLTDLLRQEISQAGYVEMLTHGLCSTAENFTMLRRPVGPAASLSNPANAEYEVVRTTLIPGALKTLAHNKGISHKEGVKLFEISDVVLPTSDNEVGTVNKRRAVALHAAKTSSFEVIHGLADRIMTCAQIMSDAAYAANSLIAEEIKDRSRVSREGANYYLKPGSDPVFFPGMCAELMMREEGNADKSIGILGVIHPEVLANYEITYPCSLLELDVEALM